MCVCVCVCCVCVLTFDSPVNQRFLRQNTLLV